MSSPQNLDELERWLGNAVGEILQTALAVEKPGGDSTAWTALLARFGVSPTPAESRQRAVSSTGMLFGASIDELYALLDRITKDGEKALRALALTSDAAEERRWQRLQGLVGRIRDETVAAYRKRVLPKRTMFARAMESARAGQPTSARRDSFILRCLCCGAPRLKDGDFTCEYCGRPFGGEGSVKP